jgi:hypothetical protein
MSARLAILAVGLLVVGCDTGHSFVAENDTDLALVARMSVTTTASGIHQETRAVTIPPRKRLVFAIQPFAGDRVNEIEFLDAACRVIDSFFTYDGGAVFVITDGPSIERRDEYPTGDPTAEATEACPAPASSPGPSPASSR